MSKECEAIHDLTRSLDRYLILPRFNGHQNLIKDEVSYAKVQQSKANLEVFK